MSSEIADFDDKVNLLRDAWKDVRLEGAELLFNFYDRFDTPFNLEPIWTVGWKAVIDGNKYGNYIVLSKPECKAEVVAALKANYEESRKHVESRTGRPR